MKFVLYLCVSGIYFLVRHFHVMSAFTMTADNIVDRFMSRLLINASFTPTLCLSACLCYPHMPIGKVWIYRLLFLCFFCNFVRVFVRLRISPPRLKLAALNFARRFSGVLGRESHILGNFAPL